MGEADKDEGQPESFKQFKKKMQTHHNQVEYFKVQVVVGDEMDDLLDLAYPGRRPEKKDLVIQASRAWEQMTKCIHIPLQTDDSYLRIARRLDNLRTAKSEINVWERGNGGERSPN